MTKKFDKLNDTFNVSGKIISTSPVESSLNSEIEKVSSPIDDIKKDYEYTRGNLYSLIEKGQEAINGILELAQESDSPRAYEVAGQLIKSVADTTDKLIDLQKKMKDLKDTTQKGPTNVTNALFIGSTTELSKLLKQQNTKDK
jgi:hypothetical protein